MHAASNPLTRVCAAFLLGSVLLGVLAPGAVAMSRTDIQQAAGQEGLSSDVQDFLNGVLEDAMLRAVTVAPLSSSSKDALRSATDRAPVFVLSSGLMEAPHGASLALSGRDHDALPIAEGSASVRTGPISPRAP